MIKPVFWTILVFTTLLLFFSLIIFGQTNPVLAASSPSGESMPTGDISGWKQVFFDDFTTKVSLGKFPQAVSDKWVSYQDGWKDTSKNGTYFPSKVVSWHDGVMDMFIHSEDGLHLVAAPVPKIAAGPNDYGQGLRGGRYVVRFKSDSLPCYKAAWLLWPDSETWPRDGEIDFPEGDLNKTISGFMHRQNGTSGSDQEEYSTDTSFSSWHTAVIEWQPDVQDVKFYLDKKLIGHAISRVPNTLMHWVLQTETSLSGCTPKDSTSGHVLIDWVSVYVPVSTTPTPTAKPTPKPSPTSVPKISNIKVSISTTKATITWNSSVLTSGKILYGTKSDDLGIIVDESGSFKTSHKIVLTDLKKEKKYYFKIISKTSAGVEFSSDKQSFKTKD